jgi:hypothetical protein
MTDNKTNLQKSCMQGWSAGVIDSPSEQSLAWIQTYG